MKCQWCGKEYPHKTGRFCGYCKPPSDRVSIPKKLLFQLMHSHSRLAQAEYERNKSYNDSHFSAQAEHAIIDWSKPEFVNEYFEYIDSVTKFMCFW